MTTFTVAAARPLAARAPATTLGRAEARGAWPFLLVLAATKVGFQLATADWYGMHRDEFYYWQSGRHLAWGYVDNPPLVPWLYRLSETVLGTHQLSLAVLPALIGGALVLVTAGLTADLGGGRRAQVLAALVAWLAPVLLTTSHFLGTATIDPLTWAVASWFLIKLVRSGDRRWWLAIGAVCGIGLLNKETVVFWAVSAAVGLLATPQRRLLLSGWLVAGVGLAGVVIAPTVGWEIDRGWPTLTFMRHLRSEGATANAIAYLPTQLGIVTFGGTLLGVAALVALWRRPEWREQRWLGIGFVVVAVGLFASGGKAYYPASWYLPLVAVGAVVAERTWTAGRQRRLLQLIVVAGVVPAALWTPILPPSTAAALKLNVANSDLGAMYGWPQVVGQVAAAFHALPASEQASAVVFTENYSQAGAVDWYGPADGLEHPAISGHNTFWLWGYGHPSPGAAVVAVGVDPRELHRFWGSVRQVTTIDGTVDPQEHGQKIYVCTDQLVSWPQLWPQVRHYD